MTGHGKKLESISQDDVIKRLQTESDGKAVKRLVAAREYMEGHSPADISRKYGWSEQTIYSWLDRLESRGIDGGLYDESRPGRPSTLSQEEFDQFRKAVRSSPMEVGLDESTWTSTVGAVFLREEFGYSFSRRHVQRLLNRAQKA